MTSRIPKLIISLALISVLAGGLLPRFLIFAENSPVEERQALEQELKKLEEEIYKYNQDIKKTEQEKNGGGNL